MPEGPSIVILKNLLADFRGKRVKEVDGTSRAEIKRLQGKRINDFKSWGKHFLICFDDFTVRIHFLMFGSYTINKQKQVQPKLRLAFSGDQELNFYACAITFIEQSPDEVYDWSSDVMSKKWNDRVAIAKLKSRPKLLVCDAILDQGIFAGAGNIFKNEVLFRIRVHPQSKIGKMPVRKIRTLVLEVVRYGRDFLKWKKKNVLKRNWEVIQKKICPRDGHRIKKRYLGATARRTFYCTKCQKFYK
jgi:endonuclease-8